MNARPRPIRKKRPDHHPGPWPAIIAAIWSCSDCFTGAGRRLRPAATTAGMAAAAVVPPAASSPRNRTVLLRRIADTAVGAALVTRGQRHLSGGGVAAHQRDVEVDKLVIDGDVADAAVRHRVLLDVRRRQAEFAQLHASPASCSLILSWYR